jgi:carboxylesterase
VNLRKENPMNDEVVMKDAEPFFFPGNDIGVLVCHGFTGSTQSMRYLGRHLGNAGYTVMAPRLKGHGTTVQDMARTTASDWIESVDAALSTLRATCSRIFMVGLSMGGTLTLYTAAKHADAISGAISINAPLQINSPDLAGLALDRQAPDLIGGIGSDLKDPNVKELAYEQVPVPALRQIYALAAVTRDLLPSIRCPVMVMHSRDDHLAHPLNASLIFQGVGSSRIDMRWLENSFHVATIDYDKDLICRSTEEFIESISEQSRSDTSTDG